MCNLVLEVLAVDMVYLHSTRTVSGGRGVGGWGTETTGRNLLPTTANYGSLSPSVYFSAIRLNYTETWRSIKYPVVTPDCPARLTDNCFLSLRSVLPGQRGAASCN